MNLPKIENIKISEKYLGLRALAVGVLILVAAIALGSALMDLLNTDPGWQTVDVESDAINVSTEFHFSYDFSDYGGSASAANKQLIQLYSQATEDAYRIFHEELDSLNSQINTPVTVDNALYQALERIVESENRNIYLAPVYVEYNAIFLSGSGGEAAQYDPAKNAELVPYISELASYASDPAMIDLELKGDNQVCLRVSEEYLAFAEEYEIEKFVDLNWMANAFIVDYLADTMTASGFTSGYIASYDGFTRNLDTRGNAYSFNLYDRQDFTIYPAGILQYDQPCSLVFLRNYPMDSSDWLHYFEYDDGSVATVFIDPEDGMSKASTDSLVAYSYERSCSEILLDTAPVFIADIFETTELNGMQNDAIHSIWFENTVLHYTEPNAKIQVSEDYGYSIHAGTMLDSE